MAEETAGIPGHGIEAHMGKSGSGRWLQDIRKGLRYAGLGALLLVAFSLVQKALVNELYLVTQPKAYIMPILYGGLTGWIIGGWYTRLKTYSMRIEEDEERLRTLVNALPDFVIFKDGQGHWLDVNEVGKQLFQFEDDSYRGLTDLDLAGAHPPLRELFTWCHHTDEETWQSGQPFHCQVSGFAVEGRPRMFDLVKVPIYQPTGERKGMLIVGRDVTRLKESEMELSQAYDSTLDGWARAVEMRDQSTENHTRRVVSLAEKLAHILQVPEEGILKLRRGALLHDIGKLAVPDSILNKPGPLTEEEMAVMRKHPQHAYDVLSKINFLRDVLDIPYCHHERWDGTGYPRGLRGEEIPLAARIFSVVDVWDALLSDRSYRKAWSEEATLAYLYQQAGRQFDPSIVQAFLDHLDEMKQA
jgi:PAS domain S-box-containing protein/putative nucleotidyltransferase with HDIG domain